MPEDYIKFESFTVISIDFLLVYKNKYYMQGYLDNGAYKVVNKQMTDDLDEIVFWRLDIINAVLQESWYKRSNWYR